MKLTAKLAYSQIKINRRRTIWTLAGIILSVAMLTAICGFLASGDLMFKEIFGENYYDKASINTIIGLAAVLGSIIIAVSVVVISNAFRVSANERTTQFGILKSVGATKHQIAEIVMYEGVWLSFIGIPVGIILGMAVHFAGIEIANYYLASMNKIQVEGNIQLILRFVFKWWTIVISAAASLLTVILSAWLPARKAAKISAINAIRDAGEVKIRKRQVRTNRLVQKLFGFEGVLASKSIKRSRRNFRATVVSLTIGIVLVVAAYSVGEFGLVVTGMGYPDLNVNAVVDYESSVSYTYGEDGKIIERKTYPIEYALSERITAKLREYPDTIVSGFGVDSLSYKTALPREMLSSKMREFLGAEDDEYRFAVTIISLDNENYTRMCEKAGVSYGSNILINRNQVYVNEIKSEFEPFIFKTQSLLMKDQNELSEPFELPLHGVLSLYNVSDELLIYTNPNSINVIVPEYDCNSFEWLANAADDTGFSEYANGVVSGMIPHGEGVSVSAVSIAEVTKAIKDVRNLMLTFIYGFVGMLILVGLTNVISTISTNIRSRSREFAVLRSTGMSDAGVKRMLNLESILCSARSLFFGLPIGCTLSYLMYVSTKETAHFPYEFPWAAVIQCVLGVFAVTWVTMRYSAGKLKSGSIIETIRGE